MLFQRYLAYVRDAIAPIFTSLSFISPFFFFFCLRLQSKCVSTILVWEKIRRLSHTLPTNVNFSYRRATVFYTCMKKVWVHQHAMIYLCFIVGRHYPQPIYHGRTVCPCINNLLNATNLINHNEVETACLNGWICLICWFDCQIESIHNVYILVHSAPKDRSWQENIVPVIGLASLFIAAF